MAVGALCQSRLSTTPSAARSLKSAYFNCIGGASGDMVLGALVDAGVPLERLNEAIGSLGVEGVSLSAEISKRGGISGTLVSVHFVEGPRSLRWQEMVHIVETSPLSATAAERAAAVFRRLAEAEAAVHGSELEETHFHELGDLDTLVDVVGAVTGVEALSVDRIYSSPLPSGSGTVLGAHGALPVPAPATVALFAMANAPVAPPPSGAPDAGEMVTPTGAAILTTLAAFEQPEMRLDAVGYGLGMRDPDGYPNVLALWTGVETGAAYANNLALLEANIDDMSAEMFAFVQERLLDAGGRDVWFTPIQMKKNRPGTMISALVPLDLESQAASLLMTETTSLGVRVRPVARYEAERESVDVETSLGTVSVKVKRLDGRNVSVSPEYEACRAIALDSGIPLQEVYRRVEAEASARLLRG